MIFFFFFGRSSTPMNRLQKQGKIQINQNKQQNSRNPVRLLKL